ncbi:MAG: 4-hydroxy-3-methylbut-2-enyl diphosphate reductase [Chitinispirillaceae bacterium]|jgi:4-hydroxy-3-methylbut-2-enyl diphosphate reductase
MKIIVAKTAGFCMGVKRAVDLALENAGRLPGGIRTIGPLIHNRQTLDMLNERGVSEFSEDNAGNERGTLLIRAHGIPPDMQERYADSGHPIIDGTCPKVKTVHRVIERYREQGFQILIAGDEGHAEVIGLLGYAGTAGHLIHSTGDIDALPDFEKICLVSQTTFDRALFDRIAARIRARYAGSDVVVKKTICAATDQRQAETETLARQVDAMIVVGGRNSANTKRLAAIASQAGAFTQLIETESEIDWNAIASCKSVGVTAGASTPNWMIKRVTDYLQFLDRSRRRSLPNFFRQLFDSAANLNVFLALGAVAAYLVSCRTQGASFSAGGAILSFFYFLAMYLWNSLTSLETTQHLGISRYRFYHRYKQLLLFLAGAILILLLGVSFISGKLVFLLMLFATVIGSVYHVTIVPAPLRRFFKYKNFKDIPSSRDLFVALAWSTVLTFIPQAMRSTFTINALTIVCFAWIFILAYLRSLIFDLRDIEGDRIMGRETLITIVGEKRARAAIRLIIGSCIALLIALPWILDGGTNRRRIVLLFTSQIGALLYAGFFVGWNPRLKSTMPAVFNVMADGLFYLAGLGALLASPAVGG